MSAARDSAARLILTTEKDLVRLLPFRPFAMPVAYVPMILELDRPDTFEAWLTGVLTSVRR